MLGKFIAGDFIAIAVPEKKFWASKKSVTGPKIL